MENLKLQINDLSVAYTPEKLAVKHVTTGILERTITAIMGPSGCGKRAKSCSTNEISSK